MHQSHRYRVRDIPLSSWDVFLRVNRRQFRCKNCRKVFSEELSFVKKRRTYTRRLAEKVVKEVLETDVVNTGERNRITVEELIPNAQVVADRFHVITQINQELDTRRKKEKREAQKLKNKKEREKKLSGIKGSKYPLLKKKEKLSEAEKEKLKQVEKVAPELMLMYQEKEKLRDIFESKITGDEAF